MLQGTTSTSRHKMGSFVFRNTRQVVLHVPLVIRISVLLYLPWILLTDIYKIVIVIDLALNIIKLLRMIIGSRSKRLLILVVVSLGLLTATLSYHGLIEFTIAVFLLTERVSVNASFIIII